MVIVLSRDENDDIKREIYTSQIPFTSLTNQVHLEMFYNRKLVIDGTFSVMEYTTDFVTLKIRKGVLYIYGINLQITSVSDESITVIGRIKSVEFEG